MSDKQFVVGHVTPLQGVTNRPAYLQGTRPVETLLAESQARERTLRADLDKLLRAAEDILDLHEDEPDRPAVRVLRETCANVQR